MIEIQRMVLGFGMGVLGYGLMLIAMTYVVVCSHGMPNSDLGIFLGYLHWLGSWGVRIWPILSSCARNWCLLLAFLFVWLRKKFLVSLAYSNSFIWSVFHKKFTPK